MHEMRRAAAFLAAFVAAAAASAQIEVEDLRKLPPTADALRPASIAAMVGLTSLNGKPYWRCELRPEIQLGKLKAGLKAALLIEAVNPQDGSAESTQLLTEDGQPWSSPDAAARSLRYVEWDKPNAPIHLRYGELFYTRVAHGLLMENYTNVDRRGAWVNLNRSRWSAAALANDIRQPELLLFSGSLTLPAPVVQRLELGTAVFFDANPIPAVAGNAFTPPYGAGEDPLTALSVSAAVPIFRNASLLLKLYDEAAAVSYPDRYGRPPTVLRGNAAGLSLQTDQLFIKAETRVFEQGFEPGLFGSDYEYRARTAPQPDQVDPDRIYGIAPDGSPDAPTQGWLALIAYRFLEGAHFALLLEDYNGGGPNSLPRFGLRLLETDLIDVIDARAFYIKRGVQASPRETFLQDLVSLDERSLLLVEVLYQLGGPLFVEAKREFHFQKKQGEDGYEPVQKTTAQLGIRF